MGHEGESCTKKEKLIKNKGISVIDMPGVDDPDITDEEWVEMVSNLGD